MARLVCCICGGTLCGLGIAALVGSTWLIFGGETFADHFIEF